MRPLSTRQRTVLLGVGFTLAAGVMLSAVGYAVKLVELTETIRGRADTTARRLELVVADGAAGQTQESLDRLVDAGACSAVVVFSPGGDLIASSPTTVDLGPTLGAWPEDGGRFVRLRIAGRECAAVSAELVNGGRTWLAFDLTPYRAAERRFYLAWGVAAGVVLLAVVLVASAIGGAGGRRLRRIRDAVDRLGDGDFEVRCEPTGSVELRELAHSVNDAAERLGAMVAALGQERSELEQQVSGRTRELEQANRLLMDIANRDALTGLANRRRLEMELERSISFSKRTGQPLAVIMMDLDKFKICNDTAGHLVGDNILRAVASTLRSRVRVTDLVVRWGGDEFCILVPATQPEGAIAAAESLVDAVLEATSAIALPAPLEPPTASAGVACFPEDGEDPHTLIRNADAALYQVKATGRGRVLRYSPGFTRD